MKTPKVDRRQAITTCLHHILDKDPTTDYIQCVGVQCDRCPGSGLFHPHKQECYNNGWAASPNTPKTHQNLYMMNSARAYLAKAWKEVSSEMYSLLCDIWEVDELWMEDTGFSIDKGSDVILGSTIREAVYSTLEIQTDLINCAMTDINSDLAHNVETLRIAVATYDMLPSVKIEFPALNGVKVDNKRMTA